MAILLLLLLDFTLKYIDLLSYLTFITKYYTNKWNELIKSQNYLTFIFFIYISSILLILLFFPLFLLLLLYYCYSSKYVSFHISILVSS